MIRFKVYFRVGSPNLAEFTYLFPYEVSSGSILLLPPSISVTSVLTRVLSVPDASKWPVGKYGDALFVNIEFYMSGSLTLTWVASKSIYLLSFLMESLILVDIILESLRFFQKGTYLKREGDFDGI